MVLVRVYFRAISHMYRYDRYCPITYGIMYLNLNFDVTLLTCIVGMKETEGLRLFVASPWWARSSSPCTACEQPRIGSQSIPRLFAHCKTNIITLKSCNAYNKSFVVLNLLICRWHKILRIILPAKLWLALRPASSGSVLSLIMQVVYRRSSSGDVTNCTAQACTLFAWHSMGPCWHLNKYWPLASCSV